MSRRELIALLARTAAVGWPGVVGAQQTAMPVVGFMNGGTHEGYALRAVPAFRQGLSETGYIADQNVKIEYYWAEGRYERLSEFAADLVRRQVSVKVFIPAEFLRERNLPTCQSSARPSSSW